MYIEKEDLKYGEIDDIYFERRDCLRLHLSNKKDAAYSGSMLFGEE
jgi:hypothetical protein